MSKLRSPLALLLVGVIAVGGFFAYVQYQAAGADITRPKAEDSVIVAKSNGQVLGHIASSGKNRTVLPDDQISPLLRQAFMAAEDRKFYKHGAISYMDMAIRLVTSGGKASGSSITQQYVKYAFTDRQRSIGRKAKEIPYAYRVEQEYTKYQIIGLYVNEIPFGIGTYGIEDGCQAWFGHSAKLLTDMDDPVQVAKASFLAAIINAQGYYEEAVPGQPTKLVHMNELVERQKYVLDGLTQLEGKPSDANDHTMDQTVSPGVIKQAKAQLPLSLKRIVRSTGSTEDADPYLVDYIRDQWLPAWQTQIVKQDEDLSDAEAEQRGKSTAQALLAQGGLKIEVSIDPTAQKLLNEGVAAKIAKRGLSAGAVILGEDGGVLAMYGGNYSVNQQNNALYAAREPGSVMKAVVLSDMVEQGISVQSKLAAPAYIDIDGPRIWNHDRANAPGCELTLADAAAYSNNIVFVEAAANRMSNCGGNRALTQIDQNYPISVASITDMAIEMGGNDSPVPGQTSPSEYSTAVRLAIGDSPTALTPLKTGVIALTLANRGVHTKPYIVKSITDTVNGTTVFEHDSKTNRVMSQDHADIVNQALTGVFTKGTASSAQVKNHPLAGKTGSTTRDIRTIAFNAQDPKGKVSTSVCSVWAGYLTTDEGSGTGGLPSSSTAGVCQYYYEHALSGKPRVDFPQANMNAGRQIGIGANKASLSPSAPSPSSPKPSPSPSNKASLPSSQPPSSKPAKTSPTASVSRAAQNRPANQVPVN